MMSSALVEMSTRECRERLASASVARLAVCGSRGPQIYPVNVAVVDGELLFRTAPYTSLGTQVVGRQVALEVDEIDPALQAGWSVVVVGVAARVEDPEEALRLRRALPDPWPSGERTLLVRIVPTHQISGRYLGRPHGAKGDRVTG